MAIARRKRKCKRVCFKSEISIEFSRLYKEYCLLQNQTYFSLCLFCSHLPPLNLNHFSIHAHNGLFGYLIERLVSYLVFLCNTQRTGDYNQTSTVYCKHRYTFSVYSFCFCSHLPLSNRSYFPVCVHNDLLCYSDGRLGLYITLKVLNF